MQSRDTDLEKFAELMGWRLLRVGNSQVFDPDPKGSVFIHIPNSEAPLPDQMAFVGKIANVLNMGVDCTSIGSSGGRAEFRPLNGSHDECTGSHYASDLVWATIQAAIEAKGA